MPDETILLTIYNENAAQARAHEQYRERITSITGALAGAVVGLLGAKGSIVANPLTSVAGGFLVLIGVFGWLASLKHYERHQLHIERLRGIRRTLDFLPTTVNQGALAAINAAAKARHKAQFPKVYDWRLNRIWSRFHMAVIVIGVILIAAGWHALIHPVAHSDVAKTTVAAQ